MMFLFLIFFILYVAFAIFFIRSTWKTSSKLQRRIVIAFFVLLPSWDMVLGYIVYYAALPFVPKEAIYETAQVDGIYYEGDYRNTVMIFDTRDGNKQTELPEAGQDFWKGYRYVESRVTEIKTVNLGKVSISPSVVYRCMPFQGDTKWNRPYPFYEHACASIENIQSEYAVKTKRMKLARNEMNFITIYNRATGKILGEYREVIRLGYDFIPFFIWLDWGEGNPERVVCPEKSRPWDFQYDVLKLRGK